MDEHDVVIALSNPANVRPLMKLGCMMAKEFEGKAIAGTVVTIEGDAPPGDDHHDRMSRGYDLLRDAERVATEMGTRFEGRIAVARGIEDVLDEVAAARHARAIIMGYSEREHPMPGQRDFDRLIDDVAAHAPCDLIVARFKDGGVNYGRVLVPVSRRLNMDVRRDLVTALHHQAGAQVDLIHFATNDAEAERMHAELVEWLQERGVADWIEPRVEIRPDPAEAIVEAGADYDALVLGTAPLQTVRRRLFGSVAEQVAENATCTTLLVRTYEGVREYYRR